VHQAAFGIGPDVGCYAKVPLVSFLGGMHLRVARASAVLGEAGCGKWRQFKDATRSISPGSFSRGVMCFFMACMLDTGKIELKHALRRIGEWDSMMRDVGRINR
jgi:hypothetical protein